jgi:hypothetical protein
MQVLDMQCYHVWVATFKAAPGASCDVCHVGVWERIPAGGETSWWVACLGLTQCVSLARSLVRLLTVAIGQ